MKIIRTYNELTKSTHVKTISLISNAGPTVNEYDVYPSSTDAGFMTRSMVDSLKEGLRDTAREVADAVRKSSPNSSTIKMANCGIMGDGTEKIELIEGLAGPVTIVKISIMLPSAPLSNDYYINIFTTDKENPIFKVTNLDFENPSYYENENEIDIIDGIDSVYLNTNINGPIAASIMFKI